MNRKFIFFIIIALFILPSSMAAKEWSGFITGNVVGEESNVLEVGDFFILTSKTDPTRSIEMIVDYIDIEQFLIGFMEGNILREFTYESSNNIGYHFRWGEQFEVVVDPSMPSIVIENADKIRDEPEPEVNPYRDRRKNHFPLGKFRCT